MDKFILILLLSFATNQLISPCLTLKLDSLPQDRDHCKLQQNKLQSENLNQSDNATTATTTTTIASNDQSQAINATSPLANLLSPESQVTDINAINATSSFKFKLDSSERLRQLRLLLQSNNYDAYLVGTNDEHGSEYVSDYDRRLRFISGFTGSNGFALITNDKAILFTDGRYTIQAEFELDCNWSIVISDDPIIDVTRWIDLEHSHRQQQFQLQHLNQQSQSASLPFLTFKIATDARLLTLPNYDVLQAHLQALGGQSATNQASSGNVQLLLISQDLIDVIWNNEQISSGPILAWSERRQPNEPVFVHPNQFTGNVSWQEKVARLVQLMAKLRARHYIIGKLDNIAWLLNLRGSDVPNSPLFKSYLFISRIPSQQQQQQQATVTTTTTATSTTNKQTMTLQADQVARHLQEQMQMQMQQPINAINQNVGQLQSPQVLQVPALETIKITLYIEPSKITSQVRDHLHLDGESVYVSNQSNQQQMPYNNNIRIQIELRDYETFISDLGNRLSPNVVQQHQANGGSTNRFLAPMQGKLLLDTKCNVAIHVLARAYDDRLILQEGLVDHLKAVKSDSEVEGMRQAHWRDSMAISMLLAKLDEDIGSKGLTQKWTEISAAKRLTHLRSLLDYNYGESFNTISAYGSNGAIIHYAPKEDAANRVTIGNESTFLLDTGGQYLDGTTDITRTVHFGTPTDFQRETYTRVLMGSIDCMSLIFFQPSKSPFRISDLFVRRHLMEIGLDYAHGTGHGIGAFSLVHEAPNIIEHYQSVMQQRKSASQPESGANGQGPAIHSEPILLQPNMFTSVEPGYYKENDFGIRLENIVVTQKIASPNGAQVASKPDINQMQNNNSSGRHQRASGSRPERQLLRFEPLSLVPFEPKLIKQELLSNRQKIWLNSYNLLVRFRMTQQIKYYLAKQNYLQQNKLKTANTNANLNQTNWSNNIANRLYLTTTSGGRLMGNFKNNKSSNNLTLESDEFREDLERAHRWILTKTQLLPLDHAQTNVPSSPVHYVNQQGDQHRRSNKRRQINNNNNGSDSQASLLDTRRLMLAYMSSLPFNDLAASEAIAALAATDKQQTILAPKSADISATQATNSSNDQSASTEKSSPKLRSCQNSDSIGCDLSLVTKLDSQNALLRNKLQNIAEISMPNRNMSSPNELISEQDDDFNELPSSNDQKDDAILNQLFGLQTNKTTSSSFDSQAHQDRFEDRPPGAIPSAYKLSGLLGRWTIVLLGCLLMLQIMLTSYAFKLHFKSRRAMLRTRNQPITTTTIAAPTLVASSNASLATSMHPIGDHHHQNRLGDRI